MEEDVRIWKVEHSATANKILGEEDKTEGGGEMIIRAMTKRKVLMVLITITSM